MLKNKRILLIIIFAIALFLIPSICRATDTFTTSDGIVATKIVNNYRGNIDFKISNIVLSDEGNYTWGISTTSSSEDVTKWYSLGDFSSSNKTATISLVISENKILDILRKTNNAWLFIKDNETNNFIIDALKVDLTLPPYYAFTMLEHEYGGLYIVGGEKCSVDRWKAATYNIENVYYSFKKVTDENLINNYKKALLSGTSVSDVFNISINDIENVSNWNLCNKDYYFYNQITQDNIPKETGIYILYLKAKDTDSKLIYGYKVIGADNESPIVSSIKVTSPSEGTYKTGQTVKVRVNFNETITGTTVPTLKIRFGDSAERALTNGTIKDNYIEYSYNIQDSDKGQIATVSLSGGTIKDAYNNDAKLSCPIIAGYTLKANVEGTQNDQTENEDTTQYISFPFIIFNGKSSLDVKNYNGNYKLYYQFVEVNDNQFDELEKLKEKYKKAEITYAEFLTQYKQILPSYNDTSWIETSDGKFEKDLSNFNGTKKFALWAKLVMDTKTVYEAEVYTMDGSGAATNVPDEIDKVTDKDQTEKEPTKDTTTKNDTKLPQTGITLLSLMLISLIAVAVISKVKYGKYKDI